MTSRGYRPFYGFKSMWVKSDHFCAKSSFLVTITVRYHESGVVNCNTDRKTMTSQNKILVFNGSYIRSYMGEG